MALAGPGAAPAGGASSSAAGLAPLVANFVALTQIVWLWGVSLLELAGPAALAADLKARLAPALLAFVEAAQAVAGAVPAAGLAAGAIRDDWRDAMGPAACAAMGVVAAARNDTSSAALLRGLPDAALASILRLSAFEPPLLAAAAAGRRHGVAADLSRAVFCDHCRVRLKATDALWLLSSCCDMTRIAPLLTASPALVAALGAAADVSPVEAHFSRGAGDVDSRFALRRTVAFDLLGRMAARTNDHDASWLRGLAM